MRKLFSAIVFFCLLGLSSPAIAWEWTSGWGPGNEVRLQGYKYQYFPISYTSATVAEVGGDAQSLSCVGLATGATEIGSTTGYVTMGDGTDYLRFRFRLPQTFVDTGNQDDLVLQVYVAEQVTQDEITYDVNLYEFNNTTAILTDFGASCLCFL